MKIYTDGSYDNNSDMGAWAFIAFDSTMKIVAQASNWGQDSTINRMEYMAFINAVAFVENRLNSDFDKCEFLTDSQLMANTYNTWISGWKRRGWTKADGKEIQNLDLVQMLDKIKIQYPNIKLSWVKAHNGDVGNEAVDRLAVSTRKNKASVSEYLFCI